MDRNTAEEILDGGLQRNAERDGGGPGRGDQPGEVELLLDRKPDRGADEKDGDRQQIPQQRRRRPVPGAMEIKLPIEDPDELVDEERERDTERDADRVHRELAIAAVDVREKEIRTPETEPGQHEKKEERDENHGRQSRRWICAWENPWLQAAATLFNPTLSWPGKPLLDADRRHGGEVRAMTSQGLTRAGLARKGAAQLFHRARRNERERVERQAA